MGHREAQAALDSDYPTARRFLLYRVGSLVNPHYGLEYWQRPEVAAAETGLDAGTVRKYMAQFARDGWLEVIELGGGRGNSTRYRWIGPPPETAPPGAVYETAPGQAETAPPVPETAPPVPAHLSIEKKEKTEARRSKSEPVAVAEGSYAHSDRAIPAPLVDAAVEGIGKARAVLNGRAR